MVFALLTLLLVGATPPDALEVAHANRDPAHVLSVFRTDSAIEDVNKGTVTVFGTRRSYQCPGGALVSETACDPCTYPVDAWPGDPQGEWIFEVDYGSDAEHEVAARTVAHFSRYFELSPRQGSEKGGIQHLLFAYDGHPRAPPPPPKVAKIQMQVGNEDCDAAQIAYGKLSLELHAVALARNSSGALAPLSTADVAVSGACAALRPLGPGTVEAGLKPGVNSCVLTVTADPGGALAHFTLGRALQLQILFEGQAADEVRIPLQSPTVSADVSLTYSA